MDSSNQIKLRIYRIDSSPVWSSLGMPSDNCTPVRRFPGENIKNNSIDLTKRVNKMRIHDVIGVYVSYTNKHDT